jgi:two-component system, LytTR family, sensor kinase
MKQTAPVLLHIGGWLLFFILMLTFIGISGDLLNTVLSGPFAVFFLVYFVLFYGNAYLLEKFYSRSNMIWYILIISVFFLLVYALQPFQHLMFQVISHDHPAGTPGSLPPGPPPEGERHGPQVDFLSLVLFVATWSLSTVSIVMKHFHAGRENAAHASAEKTKAELSFLKAQVNPHFLFNTLNNIYTLTLAKHDKAPEAVRKLSDIMRYVTDEAGNDFVPLQSEITCASDYIDLQRLRLNEKTQVHFSIIGNVNDKRVAPLIFMTFIENTFKYGISSHESSVIDISIHTNEQEIRFLCSNKIFPKRLEEAATGMGITNATRRLEHTYPLKHKLEIKQENGFYKVDLKLFNF